MADGALRRLVPGTPSLDPEGVAAEIAAILAKGYLRLLARRVATTAPTAPQEAERGDLAALDDVGEESVHGARLTEGDGP